MISEVQEPPQLTWDKSEAGNVTVRLSGHWLIEHGLIDDETIVEMLADVSPGGSIVLNADRLMGWDSSLIEFLIRGVPHVRRARHPGRPQRDARRCAPSDQSGTGRARPPGPP